MAVTNRFAEGYDVGNHILGLEHPEVCAGAAKARLHFVSNADAAGCSNCREGFAQKALRQDNLPGATHCRLAKKRCDALAVSRRAGDVPRIDCSRVQSVMRAAIDIRHRDFVNPVRTSSSAGAIELVRTEI